jgi:cephalosporin hydroxylase
MTKLGLFFLGVAVGTIAMMALGQRETSESPALPSPSAVPSQAVEDEADCEGVFDFWKRINFGDRGGIWKSTWLGVGARQNPLDVWITQEILYEIKPDFVVETGTFLGGSAALWATMLQEINPEARVITIDVKDMAGKARTLPIVQRKVDFLIGSSTDPEIVAEVSRRVAGKPVLFILDALHTRDHVLAELEAYAPMVPVGSYIIVQDTGIGVPIEGMSWAGDAVRDFLEKNDDFEVDLSRQRFHITNNARGFLRRVR